MRLERLSEPPPPPPLAVLLPLLPGDNKDGRFGFNGGVGTRHSVIVFEVVDFAADEEDDGGLGGEARNVDADDIVVDDIGGSGGETVLRSDKALKGLTLAFAFSATTSPI